VEPGLYVVATPIGNLADLTRRALEVLGAVDLIAAEDTRHSRRLLAAHALDTPVMAYHDHSDTRAAQRIEDCLAGGGSVALVSDAGTPLISDPGYRLVRRVQDRGYPVVPVPGACAAIAALSASGLPTDRFLFEGFLPSRAGQREKRLAELADLSSTLVLYEAPHRVLACLRALVATLGPGREAVLARELTKAFETIRRGSLAELADFVAADDNQRRGEFVLLVAPAPRRADTGVDDQSARWLLRLARELPARKAAAVVADCTGLRKQSLYDYLLAHKGD
jgi:16S rRNA (cytidine1402-2'-O)-methyltransferase